MDKYAFLLAKVYGVYQFRMNVGRDGVYFLFVSQENDDLRTAYFKLSYEQAERFMKMLQPESFYVCVMGTDVQSEYFNLISLTTGKLAFNFWECDFIPDVLKTHWKRLDGLICDVELLECVDEWAPESKMFDKLKVRRIANDAELALTLKQKAKVLDLHLYEFYGLGLPLSRAVVNDVVTDCRVQTSFTSLEHVMSFVDTITTVCQGLERLELFVRSFNRIIVGTFDDFLNMIASYYEKCISLVDSIKDANFTSKVDFYTNRFFLNFTFPDDWKDQLEARLGVEEVGIELIRKRYGVQEICLTSKHGRAQFKFIANF